MKNLFIKKITLTAILFFAFPVFVLASDLEMKIGSSSYDLHETLFVDLVVNTNSQKINAVEGKISFDQKHLKLVDTIDSNSIINFWIEKSATEEGVSFSGIVPGGFNGEDGRILTLVFETIVSGEGSISLENAAVFLNDGLGTQENVSDEKKSFRISNKLSQNPTNKNLFIDDIAPPESFRPEISKSESLFQNKWFLVFSTADKGSGVSYYMLKEARFKPLMFFKRWLVVESPYVLKDQSKKSFIAIKAVDRAENSVTEKVYPENSKTLIEKIMVGVLFAFGLILAIFLLKKLWNFIGPAKEW